MKYPRQKFKISFLSTAWNCYTISNFKSNEWNSTIFMGRKVFSLTNQRVHLLSSDIYSESIFRNIFYQINKPKRFSISYYGIMKTTTVQMFIMILLTWIILPLKESEASRLSKCMSFVMENRRNTEHGVLEKGSWEQAGDSLDLILMDTSNSGRISAS